MEKKRYIQPEMEVVNFNMENVLQAISAVKIVDENNKPTGENMETGGESNNEGDVPAPIFFPDLD